LFNKLKIRGVLNKYVIVFFLTCGYPSYPSASYRKVNATIMLFIKQAPEYIDNAVRHSLEKLGIPKPASLKRGELAIQFLSGPRIKKIVALLKENGFITTTDKREALSEKIKMVIEEMMNRETMPVQNVSVHIATALEHNYTYLSNVFSQVNGITIEHYIIRSRIGRAKKLISETNESIGAVAARLHYSSIAHFSTQFKKITGLTPSEFKARHLAGGIDT